MKELLMKEGDFKELLGCIVDVFEDFLEEQHIDIPNPEKEEEDTEAIIYGTHYDLLAEAVKNVLVSAKLGCVKHIYRVMSCSMYAKKVVSYRIRNMVTCEEEEIRCGELKSFCRMRQFMNASYNPVLNKLEPEGDGFEIITNLGTKREREEKARAFFEELVNNPIRVVYQEERHTIGCDPDTFLLKAGTRNGYVNAYPETEYFNRRLLKELQITGVKLDECRSIRSYDGAPFRYFGWKPEPSVLKIDRINEDMYSFRISSRNIYSTYSWLKAGQLATDILYTIYINEDINGTIYVGAGNEIMHISLPG